MFVHTGAKIPKDKLDVRSDPGVLLGYREGEAYRFLIDGTNNILET